MNDKKADGRTIRVFLVDDHPVVSEGLARLIDREADLVVCGTASDAAGAIARLSAARAGCPQAAACCKDSAKGRLISRDQYEDHRERLRQRMAGAEGREIYKRRKHTVEPRIGHMKHNLGVRRFLRRGLENVKTEWSLVCTAVNVGILLSHWNEVLKIL